MVKKISALCCALLFAFLFLLLPSPLSTIEEGTFIIGAHHVFNGFVTFPSLLPLPYEELFGFLLAFCAALSFMVVLERKKASPIATLNVLFALLFITHQDPFFIRLLAAIGILAAIAPRRKMFLCAAFLFFLVIPHYFICALLVVPLITGELPIKKKEFGLLLFGAMLFSLFLTFPELPRYPGGAKLVPDNNVYEIFRPYIGPQASVAFNNTEAVQHYLAPIAGILLLGAFLGYRRNRSSCIALALIALTIVLPWKYAVYLPPVVLERVLPFFSFISLPYYLCIFALVAVPRIFSFSSFGIFYTFALFLTSLSYVPKDSLHQKQSNAPHCKEQWLSATPSRFLLEHYGINVVCGSMRKFKETLIAPELLSFSSTPPLAPEKNVALIDGDPKTRWSFFAGKQTPGMRLYTQFSTPQMISKLVIDNSSFSADFPRGISLYTGATCAESELSLVFALPTFMGSIAWHKQLPYFTDMSTITFALRAPKPVGCVVLEQTANTEHYDWSIGELRFYAKTTSF